MRKIQIEIDCDYKDPVIEVDDDATEEEIDELVWEATLDKVNVSWREEK